MGEYAHLYPIAIFQKRYGPGWIAMARANREGGRLSLFAEMEGPWGGDWDEANWMETLPQWAADGDTPDQAVAALLLKNPTPTT